MEKETTGERIRFRRKALNLTQKAVAEKVSVSHVAISQWEKEETLPRGENLLRLAETLGCAPAWLIEGDGPVFHTVQTVEGKPGVPLLSQDAVLTWMQNPAEVVTDQWLRSDNSLSEAGFACVLAETAMIPACLPGDILFIDPLITPLPGDTVLARHEETVILRTWRQRSQGHSPLRFELAPVNPDFPLLCSDEIALELIGTLTELRRYRSG